MDVANSSHLRRRADENYESDVTPEALQELRDRARPHLVGRTFTNISSTDPEMVGSKITFR